ncbi:MAG TPA: NlpC/P60 family protein [Nocardioides sp.]|nr:NlpC/P60 family protein [Nocardioides sp.]
MRRPATGTWLLAIALTATAVAPGASADPADPPTRSDVRHARHAAHDAEDDVASVRAALASANADLDAAQVTAMQAAEAYNGALLRAAEARQHARAAERASQRADRALAGQKDVYRDTLLSSYDAGIGLDAVEGILSADGVGGLIDRSTAADVVQDSLRVQHDAYVAAADDAERAQERAEDAADEARDAADDARQARDDARSAADRAEATAATIADERDRLVQRLARLQGVSVRLAEQRQEAREARQRAEQQAQQEQPADDAGPTPQSPAPQDPAPQDPAPQDGTPGADVPDAPQAPEPADETPAAPADGAAAAVAFARDQLGEPYVWAADGPDSWDCSGLTMGAWAAGGKSLPHYSVAQYEASTPITVDQLQPGDLVFWGSSGSPSSIFHVALYVGDGMIIHAPRPGRPVSLDSMYYWIAPSFFARP